MIKTARLIKRISPRDTLLSFSVGDCMLIKNSECRYNNIYASAKALEKSSKGAMKFSITIKDVADGTIVRRDA